MSANEPEFLAPSELHQLTGAARVAAQGDWLTAQAVPHKLVDRRLIVSRVHVRAWLEGRSIITSKGPNWAAANA